MSKVDKPDKLFRTGDKVMTEFSGLGTVIGWDDMAGFYAVEIDETGERMFIPAEEMRDIKDVSIEEDECNAKVEEDPAEEDEDDEEEEEEEDSINKIIRIGKVLAKDLIDSEDFYRARRVVKILEDTVEIRQKYLI